MLKSLKYSVACWAAGQPTQEATYLMRPPTPSQLPQGQKAVQWTGEIFLKHTFGEQVLIKIITIITDIFIAHCSLLNTFLFIISFDSCNSSVCNQDIMMRPFDRSRDKTQRGYETWSWSHSGRCGFELSSPHTGAVALIWRHSRIQRVSSHWPGPEKFLFSAFSLFGT